MTSILLSFKNSFSRINERPTSADREPYPQHFSPVNRAYFGNDIRVWSDPVHSILGCNYSRCNFITTNSRYGLMEIGGFPHGIDVRNGLLAVTSMTNSLIHLIPI